MVRKVDFFFEFIGADTPMDPIDWDRVRIDQDADAPARVGKFDGWGRACVARKESRTLFAPTVTLNNTNVVVTRSTLFVGMLDQVAKVNEGNRAWSNIGVVVMYGSSIGATTALALATSLDQNSVTLNYICLSDLPLFQFGRGEDLKEVGKFNSTMPDMGKGASSPRVPFNWHFDFASNTQPDSADVPRTTLATELPNVRVKDNRYQSLGNRVKGAVVMNKWLWSSAMKGEEIHGEITNGGWNNRLDNDITIGKAQRLVGNKDDEFHIAFNLKTYSDWTQKGQAELAKL